MPATFEYAIDFQYIMRQREQRGLDTYGPFDPKSDKRILSVEAQEEVIDIGNYMRFLARKHPELKGMAYRVKRRALDLYVLLKELEQEERKLTGIGGAA